MFNLLYLNYKPCNYTNYIEKDSTLRI